MTLPRATTSTQQAHVDAGATTGAQAHARHSEPLAAAPKAVDTMVNATALMLRRATLGTIASGTRPGTASSQSSSCVMHHVEVVVKKAEQEALASKLMVGLRKLRNEVGADTAAQVKAKLGRHLLLEKQRAMELAQAIVRDEDPRLSLFKPFIGTGIDARTSRWSTGGLPVPTCTDGASVHGNSKYEDGRQWLPKSMHAPVPVPVVGTARSHASTREYAHDRARTEEEMASLRRDRLLGILRLQRLSIRTAVLKSGVGCVQRLLGETDTASAIAGDEAPARTKSPGTGTGIFHGNDTEDTGMMVMPASAGACTGGTGLGAVPALPEYTGLQGMQGPLSEVLGCWMPRGHPALQKRKRPNFGATATSVLKRHYAQCKYPNAQEKVDIALEASIDVDQVANWFTNQRGREKN